MSHDYYLVCKEKKIYMPIFSMNMGGLGLSDKRWVFDFVLKCTGSEIKFVDENNEEEMPSYDEKTGEVLGWEFMNAWHPYIEQPNQQKE